MNHIFNFTDEVHAYQQFVRENIKNIGNIIIISEQLFLKDKDTGLIDILALDLNSKQILILELKNETASDAIVGQVIKYYDFLKRGNQQLLDLLSLIKNKIDFDIDEINLTPKIMIVVPDFTDQLLRSLSYVKDIEIEIIKFNALQKQDYYEIVKEIYIPNIEYRTDAAILIKNKISQTWNFDEYAKSGINKHKIMLAKQFISIIKNIYINRKKDLNVYFYKDKITFIANKKNIAYIKMSKGWFDNSLDIQLLIDKDKPINIPKLQYNCDIIKYNILSKYLKIKCSRIPTEILNELL